MHEAHVAEVNVRNKELKPPDFVAAGPGGSRALGVWRAFDDIPLLKNGPRGDGHSKENNVWRLYQAVSGKTTIDDVQIAEIRKPPPVPFTSIFSRSDGIVSWQCCVEQEADQAENIEVHGSHSGMVVNPMVLHAIADRLAQDEGKWQRFDRHGHHGIKKYIYRDPKRA